jgi:magnesium-transporting ATPase (P-type)
MTNQVVNQVTNKGKYKVELAVNVIMIIMAGLGAAVFFVGSLIVVVTAFGNKQYAYGVLSLLFFPISIAYCLQHRKEGAYASKYLISGALLVAVTFGLANLFYQF